MSELELYTCPVCGHVDHDNQFDGGHIEHGTCTIEGPDGWPDKAYSYWFLSCAKCGAENNMKHATPEERKRYKP